jgi:hypothetical protein
MKTDIVGQLPKTDASAQEKKSNTRLRSSYAMIDINILKLIQLRAFG